MYTDLIREARETVVRFENLKQAEQALMAYVPDSPHQTLKDTTLDRIRPLMELLGNPQDRLKIVHIAGTSGKTSTAYYMAALLAATGKQVGLTVSPHVDSITERVQINGQAISEADFIEELGVFLRVVRKVYQQPSYFELLYAFTLWVLTRRNVDYAVVETGVGGLHDATNVASRPDKVCVITDIGFDHKRLLGNTLPEITAQKIGIVHEHNHIFMYQQSAEIMRVVKQWTDQHDALLHLADPPGQQTDATVMPQYQWRNWSLAYRVCEYLEARDNLPRLTRQVLAQTQTIRIPGRMDISQVGSKTIIMDGAHNEQKMTAFISSFRQLYPDTRPAVLLALKQDKDYEEVVELLTSFASRVITTKFNTTQDLPVISMDAEELAEAFRQAGTTKVQVISDYRAAFGALLDGPEKIAVITGSFYLLSQIRNNGHVA